MPFLINGSQIRVSGAETGLSFWTWAATNTSAAKQLTANAVEAIFQIKIQNGAVLDTSDVLLVINHRVEGQANATTDTGIWRCKGGMVLVQGSASQYAEEWAIQDWENVQVLIQKSGGQQSFIGSNARPTPAVVKKTKFVVKTGDVDAHLQSTGGTGVISDLLFRNEGVNAGIVALRDTDTAAIEMYRLEPFGWSAAPTTFHKNWALYNAGGNEINYHYRRQNGGAVFYSVTNSATGQKMTAIRYVSNGASASDGARSVLVGAYKPTLQSTSGTPLAGVEILIRRNSDDATEATGSSGADGMVAIVAGSTNTREQSYNNTFVVAGVTYNRVLHDAGVKYVKQSVTPVTTGGNVVSVDMGMFTVVQRRADLQEVVAVQSFLTDYDGQKTMFTDTGFTGTVSAAALISGVLFAVSSGKVGVTVSAPLSVQAIYNAWKHWTSQPAQMRVDQALIQIQNGALTIDGNVTTNSLVSAAGNVKTVAATGTLAVTGAGGYALPYTDSNTAGAIAVAGAFAADTVEMRKDADGSLIATKNGPGSFAVPPALLGVAVYFVRISGGRTLATSPAVTLAAGVNKEVPLYSGAEVQVAQAQRLELLPTAQEIWDHPKRTLNGALFE